MRTDTLTLRIASGDDAAVARLAALDSSAPIAGRALVAESGGRAVAAIAYDGTVAVADPFVRSAGAVDLLRERSDELRGRRVAAQLRRWRRGERAERRPRPAGRPALRPAPRIAASRG
jgi:hypothetical protein